MKHDISLLKEGQELIYNGIKVKIADNNLYCYAGLSGIGNVPHITTYIDDEAYDLFEFGKFTEDDVDWMHDMVYITANNVEWWDNLPLDNLVSLDEIDLPHDIKSLSREDLIDLWGQGVPGSCMLSDYNNDKLVWRDEFYDWVDAYIVTDDGESDNISAEGFADFVLS